MPITQVNFHVTHRSGTNPLQLQGTAGLPIQSVHTLHVNLSPTATETTGTILEGSSAGTLTASPSDFDMLSNLLLGLPFDVTLFGSEASGRYIVTSIALGSGFAARNSEIRGLRKEADEAIEATLGKAGTG